MEKITISKKTLKDCIKTYYSEVNNYQNVKIEFECHARESSILERASFRDKKEWTINDLYSVECMTHVSGTGVCSNKTYSFSHDLETHHLLEVMKYSFQEAVFDVAAVEFATKLRPSLLSPQRVIPSIVGFNIFLKEKDNSQSQETGKVMKKKI